MIDDSNPYHAPHSDNITPRWKIDRSGAGQRILEMIIASMAGVCAGALLPRTPGQVYNPGGLGGLICLSLWFTVRAFVMWQKRQLLNLPQSNALHHRNQTADEIDPNHP